MKQKDIFKKIGIIIEELSEQYEYLQADENNLNDLELELFVANAHFLTDHIEILSKLNLKNGSILRILENEEPNHDQKYFEPLVQQLKYTDEAEQSTNQIPASQPVETEKEHDQAGNGHSQPNITAEGENRSDTYSFILEEQIAIEDEVNLEQEKSVDDNIEDNTFNHIEQAPISVSEDVDIHISQHKIEEIAAPEYKHVTETSDKSNDGEVITINEKISAQFGEKQGGKNEQLTETPLSDIKHGISLNDKLMYVKDLFNGYNLAYSEAIEILNRFNTFEEATRFLKTNYVTKNNWAGKPETTEKFYALLKRRYL